MDADFHRPIVQRATWQILLGKAEAAKALAVPEPIFETLVREGTLPPSRYLAPGQVGWLVRELVDWAEARPTSTVSPPRVLAEKREPVQPAAFAESPPAVSPEATSGDAIMWRRELQSMLRVSSETIRLWMKDGRLPKPEFQPTSRMMGWKVSTIRSAGFPIP